MYHLSFIAVLVSGLFALASFGPNVAREAARPKAAGELLERFRASDVFYEQHDIARALIAQHERSVLPELVSYLRVEDRHVRANAALVFAGLGDPRGFDVLVSILNDRSDRADAQGLVYLGGIRAEDAPTPPQRHLTFIRMRRSQRSIVCSMTRTAATWMTSSPSGRRRGRHWCSWGRIRGSSVPAPCVWTHLSNLISRFICHCDGCLTGGTGFTGVDPQSRGEGRPQL